MSLYFIRHGQTVANSSHKFNGECDEELNDIGLNQALNAGKQFKDIKIDLVYCSPLIRTRQTLNGLNLPKNTPVIFEPRLVERKAGKMNGLDITDELLFDVYLNINNKTKFDGLEPIDEVFSRVHSVLNEIKQKHSDKNVLIVAHGFISRAVYFYFNELPQSGKLGDVMEAFLQNCEVKKYEFN